MSVPFANPETSRETARRLLVIAPHPDDDILGVGGTMAQTCAAGGSVLVIYLTNGDANRPARRASTFLPLATPSQYRTLGFRRQAEALLALHRLGLPSKSAVFLNYPDRGLAALLETHWSAATPYWSRFTHRRATYSAAAYSPDAPYCGERLTYDLARIAAAFRPTCVYLPHEGDTHPDHRAANALGVKALRALRSGAPAASPCEIRSYLVHGSRGRLPLRLPALRAPHGRLLATLSTETAWETTILSDSAMAKKYAAIRSHRSQWRLSRHFLASFIRRVEPYAAYSVPLEATSMSGPPDAFAMTAHACRSEVHAPGD